MKREEDRITFYASLVERLSFVAIPVALFALSLPLPAQVDSPARGRWMDFPGELDAFLEVEDNPSLNLDDQVTIDLWIYPRSWPQLPQSRWQLVQKGLAYNLAIWRTVVPGQILLEVNRNIFIIQGRLELGVWSHIGGAYDRNKGTVWFYLNGETHMLEAVAPQMLESQSPLRVGQQFDGGMDAVRISSRVRYKDNYETPTKQFEADARTRLLWHFEDATDSSRHGNKLNAQGQEKIPRFAGAPFRPVAPAEKLSIL